jgi:hypothetical protein
MPIDDDDLKQGLPWRVCNGFQVYPMIHPTVWSIGRWGVNAGRHQTDEKKNGCHTLRFQISDFPNPT